MNKVVSFDQDSEYLRKRAEVNRRAGRLMEALALERRAAEREPGLAVCRMEIAHTLSDMGCFVASNKVIYGLLAEGRVPAECFFGLCCNYYAMGDAEAAGRALGQYLSLDEAGLARPEVREMSARLEGLRLVAKLRRRNINRVERLTRRAQGKERAGETFIARRLYERATLINPEAVEAWSGLARVALQAGDWQKACRAGKAARDLAGMRPDILLTYIRALVMGGRVDRAREWTRRLEAQKNESPEAARALLEAYCALLDDEQVRLLAPRVLSSAPYDLRILHICAVNRVRGGRPSEQAVSFWSRITRIDPGDPIARYNLWLIAAEKTDRAMSYDYAIPPREAARWTRVLMDAQWLGDEALYDKFKKTRRFEEKCRWALSSGNRQAMLLSRAVLRRLDEPWAARLLNEAMGECATPAFGGDAAIMPLTGEEDDVRVPAPLRKAMKWTCAMAGDDLDDVEGLAGQLTLEVMRHRMWKHTHDERAWFAVMLYACEKLNGKELAVGEAAALSESPVRRVRRCLRLVGIKHDPDKEEGST